MYCASYVLVNSVVDIGATASCAQGVELTSPTDDTFAAKNLNRSSAGGIASVADDVIKGYLNSIELELSLS